MKKEITIVMEMDSDGGYACSADEAVGQYILAGYGDTVDAAKMDLLVAYGEFKKMATEKGEEMPELEFTYKYDIQSFFKYFYFLDVDKVTELSKISPSQMKQYTSGAAYASQEHYEKIMEAVELSLIGTCYNDFLKLRSF